MAIHSSLAEGFELVLRISVSPEVPCCPCCWVAECDPQAEVLNTWRRQHELAGAGNRDLNLGKHNFLPCSGAKEGVVR